MREPKGRRNILSQRQLAFVAAHLGNDTEAARTAGYKNPGNAAPKLMGNPRIRKAIETKQQAAIQASGTEIGRRLTRLDVVSRLLELANLPLEKTRGNMTGQVNALRVIAEIQGYFVHRHEDDLTKVFEGWAKEELQHYAKTREIPERFSRGSGNRGTVM